MNPVTVEISEDNIKVLFKQGGRTATKNVAVEDFIAAIQKDMVLRTGIQARGVREFLISGNRMVITLEVPPRIRDIVFHDRDVGAKLKYKIPFPALVFIFEMHNKILHESWCFATKEPLWKPSVELHLFPFGNVHPDGKICWGSGNIKSDEEYSAANVSTLVEKFIKAPFNTDLSQNIFLPPRPQIKTTHDLIKSLHDTFEFPFDILKAISSYEAKVARIFKEG